MADIFVYASGSNTAPYDTWAKAATALNTAIAAGTNADRILVDDAQNESIAGLTVVGPSTPGMRVISVTQSGASGYSAVNRGATISITGANDLNFSGGHVAFEGMIFNSTSSSNRNIFVCSSGTDDQSYYFKDCLLDILRDNSSSNLAIGPTAQGNMEEIFVEFLECEFGFTNINSNINVRTGSFIIRDCALSSGSIVPTALFSLGLTEASRLIVEDCDLSASNLNLVTNGAEWGGLAIFERIKLHASASIFSSVTLDRPGSRIEALNVSNADNVQAYAAKDGASTGDIVTDDTTYLDASDGTTSFSIKLTPGATGNRMARLYSPDIRLWNDGTSEITPKIRAIVDHADGMTDDQIGVDWRFEGSGPQGQKSLSGPANIADAGSSLTDTADSGSWTNPPGTEETYDFEPTFTPGQKGWIVARPWVAFSSSDFTGGNKSGYFNPRIEI